MPHSLPTVSALMGAYNYEQYVGRAIESALTQEYPPELLEVVVIDDGSTDSTAEIVRELARRNPGRVRLISQRNAGATAATNRALAEATGELLCLLDADDVWLPDKTRRQVELLQSRPALGLVFCDMRVVDGKERTVRPSHAGRLGEIPERAFARVLHSNVATQSSIMIRSSLREYFDPIPSAIPYADWWLVLRAAQHAEIDYVREPLALYRIHGSNLTGQVTGAAKVREHRKEIAFQLWALRHVELDTLTAPEMAFVWSGVEAHARQVIEAAGTYFASPVEVGADEVARADALLAEADRLLESGDLVGETRATLQALAWDPFRLTARKRLSESIARANAAELLPHPLHAARPFVLLADAEDLLADDRLLTAYAEELGGCAEVTLAIDASRLPVKEVGEALHALVDRCGLSDRHDIDLVAVTGPLDPPQRHRMLKGSRARYLSEAGDANGLPVYTPSSLPELRATALV
jgi:hypothetical protein